MKKTLAFNISFFILSVCGNFCYAQNPFYSESLIKYDLTTHKTDKPIPYDRSFTLVIDKLSSKNIIAVHAYQAKFKKGNRILVENSFRDCDGTRDTAAIKDVELKTNPYSDTLQIFFPPLKPNIDFDVKIIYNLQSKSRNLLFKVNSLISESDTTNAQKAFSDFFKSTLDALSNESYCSITSFAEYRIFYNSTLTSLYADISNPAKYNASDSLSENQITAIDVSTSQQVYDFKDGAYLLEVYKRNLFVQILLGNRDISKVFLPDEEVVTNLHYADIRLQNLESNIKYFDSVMKRIDRVISKGISAIYVRGTNIDLNITRTTLQTMRTCLKKNYIYLAEKMKVINTSIDKDPRIKQGVFLAGNTVSTDLKSAGGNLLFLDAGITNIIVSGLNNKAVNIPRLYWGISIYFRPIDKNTRQNRFKRNFDPKEYYGCHIKIDSSNGILKRDTTYGPDYGIVTKRSIWQHLALNVGITIGSIPNKDFENFYNNTSLLIGPAYRFRRAFKVSAGIALLKRSSTNPLISEKKVVVGGYFSTSVDIDFIQGIKDITSILFK